MLFANDFSFRLTLLVAVYVPVAWTVIKPIQTATQT